MILAFSETVGAPEVEELCPDHGAPRPHSSPWQGRGAQAESRTLPR